MLTRARQARRCPRANAFADFAPLRTMNPYRLPLGAVSCFLESSLEVQDGHLQLILMKMWANARKVQKILEECFYNRKGKAIEELKVEIIKRSCFVCVRMSALTLVWASNASLSA